MRASLLLATAACVTGVIACSSDSVVAPAETGAMPDGTAPDGSGSTDSAPARDAADTADTNVVDGGSTDAADASTKCAPADVVASALASVDYTRQLQPFAGALWATGVGGLTRITLPGGATTTNSAIGVNSEMWPHGPKLLVVDKFDIVDVDPVTLATTAVRSISGAYSNYFPRTALEGDALYLLSDEGIGSALTKLDLGSGTATPLWTGAKAWSLHRGGHRSYIEGADHTLSAIPDVGSGAPSFDATKVDVYAADESAIYFSWNKPGAPGLYRLPHTASDAVALDPPASIHTLAGDGTRVVGVSVTSLPSGEELHAYVYAGGTWTTLPCVAAEPLTSISAAAVVGDHAYVVIRAGAAHASVVRIALM